MPLLGWFTLSFLILAASAYEIPHYLLLSPHQLFALLFLLIALFFLLLDFSIASPLSRLTRAMKRFTDKGDLTHVNTWLSPREIRTLAKAFSEMSSKFDATHRRDQEVSRVKSDFISTAAHQFRTPLTGIRWALEALENANPTENQKMLIDDALRKSRDLVVVVSTLLDISAIESGRYNYQFARVDVPPLLIEIAKDFAPRAKEKELALLYEGSDAPIPFVKGDRDRLKWLLNNLVDNALAYTPQGGRVRLSAESVAGTVLIHVQDTGIGILAKDRGNIFERFFRGENAVAKENVGNGLGLYIARTIATDHGGDLTFKESAEGSGTIFTLSLPALP